MKRKLINFVLVIFFLFHKSKHLQVIGNDSISLISRDYMQGFKIIITVVFMLGFQDLNVMTLLGEDAVDQSMMNTTSQSNETSSKGLSCYISSIAIFSVIYGVENLVVFELYSYIFFAKSLYETMLTTLEYFGKILFLSSIWLILQH